MGGGVGAGGEGIDTADRGYGLDEEEDRAELVAAANADGAATGNTWTPGAVSLPDAVAGQAAATEEEKLPIFLIWVISVVNLLRVPEMLYYAIYVTMTVLGNLMHAFFFSFHLFDIVNRYTELKIVLKSVSRPAKPLVLTGVLFFVLNYMFTVFGFAFFREDYGANAPLCEGDECAGTCTSLFGCFFVTFDQGLKNDGGLGGYLQSTTDLESANFPQRIFFDTMYNGILLIIMLNVVFGIIIDTFAELREETKSKEDDMLNTCFVCNIDRGTFDRSTRRGFEYHIKHEHYMWHYLELLAHLRFKPRTELTGLEEALLRKVLAGDLSFFPVHRAMALASEADEEGKNVAEIARDVRALRAELAAMQQGQLARISRQTSAVASHVESLAAASGVVAGAVGAAAAAAGSGGGNGAGGHGDGGDGGGAGGSSAGGAGDGAGGAAGNSQQRRLRSVFGSVRHMVRAGGAVRGGEGSS